MSMIDVPVIAVIGHPNEGKSSVVSTLTENDRVPISRVPGETRKCVSYNIELDGQTLVRIVDTPGFQMPKQTLRWMKEYSLAPDCMVEEFIRIHREDSRFVHDCELLQPISKGAGIIYVVDTSRPLRSNDREEMEILRLTGRPRMAVMNPKLDESAYLGEWKALFAQTFNISLQFNAHRATFTERIALLEALQYIEQDWGSPLRQVVSALKDDWGRRLEACADDILLLLENAHKLSLSDTSLGREPNDRERMRSTLISSFQKKLVRTEEKYRKSLKGRFLHNVFNVDLAAQTVANQNLFSGEVWKVLGLTRNQLAAAFAAIGATTGAAIDTAAAGTTFGIFTFGIGAVGVVAGLMGTRPLSRLKVDIGPFSRKLGGCQITVGPLKNPQLMFVLLDRAFIYFECVSNWAHAKREEKPISITNGKKGITSQWDKKRRQLFVKFQTQLRKQNYTKANKLKPALKQEILSVLQELN